MMRPQHIYCKNVSGEEQPLRHPKLRDVGTLPVAPGGYVLVTASRTVVQPDQCFRVPLTVWGTTPSLWRQPWAERITEAEFLAASETPTELEVDTASDVGPLFDYDGRRVRLDQSGEKRVYFTDTDEQAGWASREKWDAKAVSVEV